jgi:predicted transport protein
MRRRIIELEILLEIEREKNREYIGYVFRSEKDIADLRAEKQRMLDRVRTQEKELIDLREKLAKATGRDAKGKFIGKSDKRTATD